MKKLFLILIGFFLLSLCICGCAKYGTPAMKEATEPREITPVIRHFYNIDGERQDVGDYTDIEKSFLSGYEYDGEPIDKVYDSNQLSYDTIVNRKGRVICERCIGIVTDADKGEGRILNAVDEEFNHISYRYFDQPYKEGTVIITYLVYNPYTSFDDDIVDRYDFVLTREFENK